MKNKTYQVGRPRQVSTSTVKSRYQPVRPGRILAPAWVPAGFRIGKGCCPPSDRKPSGRGWQGPRRCGRIPTAVVPGAAGNELFQVGSDKGAAR
jgi:hypothetical protein